MNGKQSQTRRRETLEFSANHTHNQGMGAWQERLLAFVLFVIGMAGVGWLLTLFIDGTPEWVSDIVIFGGLICLIIYALLTRRRR